MGCLLSCLDSELFPVLLEAVLWFVEDRPMLSTDIFHFILNIIDMSLSPDATDARTKGIKMIGMQDSSYAIGLGGMCEENISLFDHFQS